MKKYNFLIAAGGTGGHLFPAIAVVEELSKISEEFSFYFTGRTDKIEGKVVQKLGYPFFPIEVEGLRKIFSLKNLLIPFKILQSEIKLKKLIKREKISAVIATGCYISYAPCVAAYKMGIPVFLLESNFNPGKSISMLAAKSDVLFTSFPETEKFFENKTLKKIVYAGNPVRNLISNVISQSDAKLKLGFNPEKKLVFVFGGSLGSKAINDTIEKIIPELEANNIQLYWQTGSTYTGNNFENNPNIVASTFIEDMVTAYSAADLIVSRAGASTMSELAIAGKPSILIPLQIGINKEQEYNARFFEKNGASIVVEQSTIQVSLLPTILDLLNNTAKTKEMEICIRRFAKPEAGSFIANSIVEFLETDSNIKKNHK